jgi:uncharacterized protein (TIGR02284 family)
MELPAQNAFGTGTTLSAATPNLNASLDELISLAREAEWVYSNVALEASDAELTSYAMKRAAHCLVRADDLAAIAVLYGRSPNRTDSMRGFAHRTWTQLRIAMGGQGDLRLLNDCERIEDDTLRAYAHLLRHPLPASLRIALQGELVTLQLCREQLQDLGNRMFGQSTGKQRVA